jgi:hypothetical protein
MTVTAYLYGAGLKALVNEEIDWDTDDIRVALCTSSYTPAQTTHDYFNDITNELSTGDGYTAGGSTLANATATHSGGTVTLDADNLSWAAMTGTARYAIIYDVSSGTVTTAQPLIAYVDFGDDVISTGGTFTITWAVGGIATYAVTLA